jgi:16S rRNA C967 or C1407 C5-methylase (RsmB/RsmF family)
MKDCLSRGGFSPVDPRANWSKAFPEAAAAPQFSDLGVTPTPRRTDTDGFFCALLRRV